VPDRPDAKNHYAMAALTPPFGTPNRPSGVPDGERPAHQFIAGVLFASRYRMVAPLGPGGLGELWRADDLVLQTPVALKVLPPAVTHARSRILEEVRLARQVTHPAVCRVFDVGEAEGCVFFSMELIDGPRLIWLIQEYLRKEVLIGPTPDGPPTGQPRSDLTDAMRCRACRAEVTWSGHRGRTSAS